MPTSRDSVTSTAGGCGAAWDHLDQLANTMASVHLADLFTNDPARFDGFHRRCGPLLLDFSKERIDAETLNALCQLADACGVAEWRERLFAGDTLNSSEDRAAMHWALRLPSGSECMIDGEDVAAEVHNQLDRMAIVVEKIHAGQWRGATGEPITDVVNIGVGGSDLGPLMVSKALAEFKADTERPLRMHFVSTMDGSQLAPLLPTLNPGCTLFIISSKSFSTVDTLSNAHTARLWLQRHLGDLPGLLSCHFIGVSVNAERMTEWGIHSSNQLRLWEWVGGRFSLWSTIGLPIALTIGMARFRELLAGAHQMDQHFQSAPWSDNLPVLTALIGIWNGNLLGINAHAILPYDGRLKHLPAYLEQLEMESNGKRVTRSGELVPGDTCPVIWGGVGPNAQHAFYQLLHQGTQAVTCDFILPARRYHEPIHTDAMAELAEQHQLAIANCLAQSRLLALGDAAVSDAESLPLHKRYYGNQPSSTTILDELTPYSLGALIALYEHKVFTQAVLWGINPFDQWGVEMGKQIATELLAVSVGGETAAQLDSSTTGLLEAVRKTQSRLTVVDKKIEG